MAIGVALLIAGEASAETGDTSGPGSAVPKAGGKPKATIKDPGAVPDKPAPVNVVANFGEWALVCPKAKDGAGKEPCTLAQALIERQSQKLVFRVIFGYGPGGHLIMEVDSPTGVALQKGLEFSPDTKKIYRLPFHTCLARGCRAVLIVPEELKGELAKSDKGTITVYALSGQAVRAVTALSGLSEGLAALDKRRTAGQ